MAAPTPSTAPGAPGDWRAKVSVPPLALCIFSRQLAVMLRNAVPKSYKGPTLTGKGGEDVAIEEIVIASEGFEIEA